MKKSIDISETLTVPRLVVGLWQIADMERNNQQLNFDQTASFMDSYVDAGFTTFDMADHYGSSEIIAGICKNNHAEKNRFNCSPNGFQNQGLLIGLWFERRLKQP